MSVTLGHWFVVVALVELVFVWRLTAAMRAEDERKPEAERRPARLIMAAGVLASAGLVAAALLHPVGRMPIFEI